MDKNQQNSKKVCICEIFDYFHYFQIFQKSVDSFTNPEKLKKFFSNEPSSSALNSFDQSSFLVSNSSVSNLLINKRELLWNKMIMKIEFLAPLRLSAIAKSLVGPNNMDLSEIPESVSELFQKLPLPNRVNIWQQQEDEFVQNSVLCYRSGMLLISETYEKTIERLVSWLFT